MRSHFSFCLISTDLVYMYTIPFLTLGLEDAIGRKEELQNRTKFFSIFRILPEIFFNRKSSFSERIEWGFSVSSNAFFSKQLSPRITAT